MTKDEMAAQIDEILGGTIDWEWVDAVTFTISRVMLAANERAMSRPGQLIQPFHEGLADAGYRNYVDPMGLLVSVHEIDEKLRVPR